MIQNSTPSRKLGISMALLTAFLWAVLAIKLKLTLKYLDSYTIVWFRLAFAFSFVFLLKLIRSPRDLFILKSPPFLGLIAGLGLGVNFLFFMRGVELTSASNAQILIQLAPMGLILVGVFIFRERPRLTQIFGFCLALLGFILFYRDQLETTILSERSNFDNGNIWILFSAAGLVLFAALQKPLLKIYDSEQLNLLFYGVAALMMIPFAHWSIFLHLPLVAWLLLIALGLNTIIAYGALSIALKNLPTSQVSVIIAANPLLTLLIMAALAACEVSWIAPEHIAGVGYFGAGLVVVGVLFALQTKKLV